MFKEMAMYKEVQVIAAPSHQKQWKNGLVEGRIKLLKQLIQISSISKYFLKKVYFGAISSSASVCQILIRCIEPHAPFVRYFKVISSTKLFDPCQSLICLSHCKYSQFHLPMCLRSTISEFRSSIQSSSSANPRNLAAHSSP